MVSFHLKPCSGALPLIDRWHSCLRGQRSQPLDGYRQQKMSCLNMPRPDLPPSLHFLPPAPQFILIIQWKLSSMEWLPAVSHKPLIVLWSWIVAFYHPAMVKGTFATGVGHAVFSGNANGFQDPSFYMPDICDFVCASRRTVTYIPFYTSSYSLWNPIQFPNWMMNINALIHNHLSLIHKSSWADLTCILP